MLFRNLQIFQFIKNFSTDLETLEKQLSEESFTSCGSQQLSSFGWVSPLGKAGEMLTHKTANRIMICAQREERLLPATVIRDKVESDAEQIENEQGRRVFPSERRRLRDEAIQQLLPKAFTKQQQTFAYIDLDLQLLIVDAASHKRAEELTILLRQTLGTLPIIPMMVKQSPSAVMSHWILESSLAAEFETGSVCELRDLSDNDTIIRTKGISLESQEFINHIETGMQVSKIELAWNNKCQFVLKDDFSIGRLRFDDILRESLKELDKEDVAGRFDADFSIMGGELAEMLPAIFTLFGGQEQDVEAADK